MGTAITPEQVKLLSAYAEEAVLALDADRAGREAMLRAQAVGGKRLRLRVARMPEGKDPADLLAGGDGASATAFREAIEDGGGPAGVPRPHAARRRRPGVAVGARPGARRGGRGDRGDGRLDHPRGADARGRRPARRRSGAGGAAGGGARGGGRARGRRRGPVERLGGPEAGGAARRAAAAERARAARAGAAGDVREAAGRGRGGTWSRLTDEHFSRPAAARARAWLRDHLEDPIDGPAARRRGAVRAT